MTVETLIASRSVCSSWRRLLPHAENAIHPVRLRLYKLYLTIIDNPKPDPRSQRYIRRKLKKKKKFDREAYIRHLQGQNLAYATRVPEEFQIWVLEWPAKLVINGLWPGLPFAECYMDTAATGGSSLRYGVNYIAVKPAPKLDRIVASYTEQEEDNRIWALPLWSTCWDKDSFLDRWCHDYEYRWRDREAPLWDCDTWLILDTRSDHFGKVVECPYEYFHNRGALDDLDLPSFNGFPDWIEYLEDKWFGVPPCGRTSTGTILPKFLGIIPFVKWKGTWTLVYYDTYFDPSPDPRTVDMWEW